ncbi:hypothetical protein BDY21DRAFT_336090 [Lineolata rhizophorae]|uniref:Uncharacterized protein n=1 Tax=Lineolata rhizophorae TaxID=578093 RepID=A0A6A6P9W9_9PEZI|nr:hypothetical protein BDY21DRAFT_336090 [Lineolata rhizophorae]
MGLHLGVEGVPKLLPVTRPRLFERDTQFLFHVTSCPGRHIRPHSHPHSHTLSVKRAYTTKRISILGECRHTCAVGSPVPLIIHKLGPCEDDHSPTVPSPPFPSPMLPRADALPSLSLVHVEYHPGVAVRPHAGIDNEGLERERRRPCDVSPHALPLE